MKPLHPSSVTVLYCTFFIVLLQLILVQLQAYEVFQKDCGFVWLAYVA